MNRFSIPSLSNLSLSPICIYDCIADIRIFAVSILGKPYCYFNGDFQGNFTTQVPYDNFIDEVEENQLDFHYSRVEIELDRIQVWGECHRKLGENYILAMRQVNG